MIRAGSGNHRNVRSPSETAESRRDEATARVENDQALRATFLDTEQHTRARLAAIVESSDDAIVSKTLDGIITSWNRAAERIFGYSAMEAIGQHISLIVPADRRAEEDEVLTRLRRGERIDHFETERLAKDGRRLNISLTVSPLKTSDGQIVGASKVARDITERKRTEALRAYQTQVLQMLAEDAPVDSVLEFLVQMVEDHSAGALLGSIVPLNGAGTRFQRGVSSSLPNEFNLAVEGIEVSSFNGICCYAVSDRGPVIVSDFTADPQWARFAEFVAPYGLRAGWSTPIFGADGSVLGTFANYYREPGDPTPQDLELVDIVTRTAAVALTRKRAEEESVWLRNIQHEAQNAAYAARADAEAARQEAEVANRGKSEFLASMSHELRTPLNAILGYADLMEMGIHGTITEGQRTALARVRLSGQHLLRLISDVLEFAKLEAGVVKYNIAPVPMDRLLTSLELLIAPQVAARELHYHYERCEPGTTALGDAEKVTQILVNLLTNALKFTPPGGDIRVGCVVDDGHVLTAVRDSGVGIAREKLDLIFEPFVQADQKLTRAGEGTGLGLAISRDMSRAMAGDIRVESAVHVGSTFTLVLPRSV